MMYIFLFWMLFDIRGELFDEYDAHPESFKLFTNESQREEYKLAAEQKCIGGLGLQCNEPWIDRANLVNECKPIIYFNKLYEDKLQLFSYVIIATLFMTVVFYALE